MAYLGRPGATAPLTAADIPDNSITAAKIVADTIAAGDIGNDAVGTAELANDVIISTSGAITTTGAFTSVGIDDNANATAITIDSSENVGIGATTVDEMLHLESSASAKPVLLLENTNADGTGPKLKFNKDGGSAADNDEIGRIQFDADNDAAESLQWFNIIAYLEDASNGSETTKLKFVGRSGGGEKIPLQVSGDKVLIGNPTLDSTTRTLMIKNSQGGAQGDTYPILVIADNNSTVMWLRGDGRIWIAETIDENSDENMKENISYISTALSIVNDLKPATFDKRAEYGGSKDHAGFIAQDVEDVLPHAVSEGVPETGNMKALHYNHFIPYLTKAIQELSVKNDALEAKVTALEARIKALEDA